MSSPRASPQASITSSKTITIQATNFNLNKGKINNKLLELESDDRKNHSEYLKEGADNVAKMLVKQKVDQIISKAEEEPDFYSIFGATEDEINDWRNQTEDRIDSLLDKASQEISARKASVQSGFTKLKYPTFQGDILNYQEFKSPWENEVVPERRPEAIELAALREAVNVTVRNKITEVKTLSEAWKIMDLNFGDMGEVRAKVKGKIMNIKLKSTDNNSKEVELFNQVQFISTKLKAAQGISMLEADQEYIALIKCNLPDDTKKKWVVRKIWVE